MSQGLAEQKWQTIGRLIQIPFRHQRVPEFNQSGIKSLGSWIDSRVWSM